MTVQEQGALILSRNKILLNFFAAAAFAASQINILVKKDNAAMKKQIFKFLPLACVSLALVGCAGCPGGQDYEQVPYSEERTAGEGMYIHQGPCERQVTRTETRDTRGERVFHERVTK
jgi:hypothetical protein